MEQGMHYLIGDLPQTCGSQKQRATNETRKEGLKSYTDITQLDRANPECTTYIL